MAPDCTLCNQTSSNQLHDVQLHSCTSRNMLISMMLSAIREAKGLRQEDLGEMIGKNKSTISRAEAMAQTAKLVTYRDCADALDVPLAALFAETMEEADLIIAFHHAKGDARSLLAAMARQAKDLPPSLPDVATPSAKG